MDFTAKHANAPLKFAATVEVNDFWVYIYGNNLLDSPSKPLILKPIKYLTHPVIVLSYSHENDY